MLAPETTAHEVTATVRPLGLPAELWEEMSEQHRSACTSAQALLGAFGEDRTVPLRAMSKRVGLSMPEALEGLRVLDGMDLVRVQPGDHGPLVTVMATPEDHVRIMGPDGAVRWVFIARPIDPPEVEEHELN